MRAIHRRDTQREKYRTKSTSYHKFVEEKIVKDSNIEGTFFRQPYFPYLCMNLVYYDVYILEICLSLMPKNC